MPLTDAELDDLPTTLAIGVLASVAQFVVHEVVGHGSVCALLDGDVVSFAPLWMRCTFADRWMVLAGPLANVVAGGACWAILHWRPPTDARIRLFLWLSIAFQWLVAAGYLGVGALSGFGDWPILLPSLLGSWPGRITAVLLAAGLYVLVLHTLARIAVQGLGSSALLPARLRDLALLPSLAAAVVSVVAEFVGHRLQPLGLALAVGCTAVVGWSLLTLSREAEDAPTPTQPVRRSKRWIAAGAIAACAFVIGLGPAWQLVAG